MDLKEYLIIKYGENYLNRKKISLFNINLDNFNELANLKNLEELDLSYTNITNIEPIRGLKKLKCLDVSKTKITNLEPIRNCKKLKDLDVSYLEIEDITPILDYTNIKYFNLFRCKIPNSEFAFTSPKTGRTIVKFNNGIYALGDWEMRTEKEFVDECNKLGYNDVLEHFNLNA